LVGSTKEERRVMDIAFSPDSQLVGYGTIGNAVRVRRTDTLAIAQDFTGFDFANVYVAFSPHGKIFAVAQKEIRLYDTETWRRLPVEFAADEIFAKATFAVRSVDFSPDGTGILAAGLNLERGNSFGRTVVWQTDTGKQRFGVSHKFPVDAAAFSPDGKKILSGSSVFLILDAETGEVLREVAFQRTPCYDAGWSPDSRRFVAAGAVRGCAVFDVGTGEQLPIFDEPPYPKANRSTACYTPDGSQIVTGGLDKIIRVYDVKSLRVVMQFPSSGGDQPIDAPLLAVATSLDGRWIAAAREDEAISIHDPKSGEIIKTLKGHGDVVSSVAFASNGILASGSYDETIKLWDVEAGKALRSLAGHENWVFGVAFSPDGKSLASAGYDKTVRVWNVETGKQTALLEGHTAGVRDVAFSPDVKLLASAGSDRIVKVWELETGKEVAELNGHTGTVRDVAFSPDGKLLGSAAEDSSVRVWSTEKWEQLHNLAGHQGMVWSLAFSAGSSNLVTGGFDNTVKVWNPKTGELRQTLQGHRDAVSSVAFLPDTSAIVSGGMDRSLRIWRADRVSAKR
jgi:WD40 repeat protein